MENLVITLKANNELLKDYYKILEAVTGTDATRKAVTQQIEENSKIIVNNKIPAITDNGAKEKATKIYGGALMLSENSLDINEYRGCINEINEALKVLDAGTINNIIVKTKKYIATGKVKNPQGYIITSLQKARGGIV